MIKGSAAEKLNKELKAISENFRQSYEIARTASENRYKQALPPGAIFHPRNGFYDQESKNRFKADCDTYRQKAHALLDDATKDLMDEYTKAPTTEAVNVITLLATRKDVSADEIDQVMLKYGTDCPQAYKALFEIAQGHGYHDFMRHPVEVQAEAVRDLDRAIDRCFDASAAERSGAKICAAGFDTTVDQTFPVEGE